VKCAFRAYRMTNLHGWCTVLDRPFPKFCPLLNPLHKDEEKEDGDVDEFEEIGDNNINTKSHISRC